MACIETPTSTCCCGCCSVRTGTKLIAIIYVFQSVFSVLIDISQVSALCRGERMSLGWGFGIRDSDQKSRSTHGQRHNYKLTGGGIMEDSGVMYGLLAFGMALGVLQFLCSALLCVGVVQNHERKCLPWLWYNSVLTAAVAVSFTVISIYYASVMHDHLASFIFFASLAIGTLVNVYLLNVVYRYIQQVKRSHSANAGHGHE